MQRIEIDNILYDLVKNEKECFNLEELKNIVTDYFYEFDYIFGDYAYDKLRLKGYYENNSEKMTEINDIKYLDDYIKNYCSYGAKYFLLKKVE